MLCFIKHSHLHSWLKASESFNLHEICQRMQASSKACWGTCWYMKLRMVCGIWVQLSVGSWSFPNLHEDEDSEANLASLTDLKEATGTGHLQVLRLSKRHFMSIPAKNLERDVHLCARRGTPLFSPVTMSQARISKSPLFVNGSESELATAH